MNALMSPRARRMLAPMALLGVLAMTLAMRTVPSTLERVLTRGELVVVSRISPTTWYSNQHGETGLEFELAHAFAQELGVSLRMVNADSLPQLYAMLKRGEADMAAAALAVTDQRRQSFRFTSPYQSIDDILIQRSGEARPGSIEDLAGKRIAVLRGSGQEQLLRQLRARGFDVVYDDIAESSAERLLTLLEEGYFDYALIDSNSWTVHRSLFPELRHGLNLGQQSVAWAFQGEDASLQQAAESFLTRKLEDGTVARLEERFFGHINQFNLYAARSFLRHLDDRLPRYLETFQHSAAEHGFDWRLLAAMGYQESLWDAEAVSPTGVRGLMMLTNRTAAEMGVHDRTDPQQSIRAGAAYLRKLHDRIPERIAEPDRTWMALAAYNVGMGHVEDARVLTERQGGDPDSWQEVKQRLPLLRNERYYQNTRYGYARGAVQSVIYVRHIRRYYDLLVWATGSGRHADTLVAMSDSVPGATATP